MGRVPVVGIGRSNRWWDGISISEMVRCRLFNWQSEQTLKILGVLTTVVLTTHTLVAWGLDSGAKSGWLMPNGNVVQNDFQTLPIEQVLKDHRVKELQTNRLTSSLVPVVGLAKRFGRSPVSRSVGLPVPDFYGGISRSLQDKRWEAGAQSEQQKVESCYRPAAVR